MATLKSLVDETTNIKNELVECYDNLKNNLIEKGVECSEDDKMLSLINRVKDLTNYKAFPGTSIVLATRPNRYTCSSSYAHFYNYTVVHGGGLRIKWYMENYVNGNSGNKVFIKFNLVRNGEIIQTVERSHYQATLTQDFVGILAGDIIQFFGRTNYDPYGYIQDISITCNIL